jgi:predicted nucleotidyltransferase
MDPLETLTDRCRREGVRLVYAAERGSRCYGTEDSGSDWDIQAVVVLPPLAYTSVSPPPPVWTSLYEGKVSTTLFNAPRAALMLAKGKVKLREAAYSSCVLFDAGGVGERLRAVSEAGFNPFTARQQYLQHMCDAIEAMPPEGEATGRRWLHLVLPLLSDLFVERHGVPAPVRLDDLVAAGLDPFLSDAAGEALAAKRGHRPVAYGAATRTRLLGMAATRREAVHESRPAVRTSTLPPELVTMANELAWDLIGVPH